MPKTYVIGDIHGAYQALKQCLERSHFDVGADKLVCLGDVCDGWPETKECINLLLDIPHLTYILGNHDFWMLEWMRYGRAEEIWLMQGGQATVDSYRQGLIDSHLEFLEDALPYYLLKQKLFVHAGIDPNRSLDQQGTNTFLWDRKMARMALDFHQKGIENQFGEYDEIYVGHTPIKSGHPIKSGNVWLMDTGAGWSGVLSMMDIDSKEIFTSDAVPGLYPGIKGRSKY